MHLPPCLFGELDFLDRFFWPEELLLSEVVLEPLTPLEDAEFSSFLLLFSNYYINDGSRNNRPIILDFMKTKIT